MLVHIIPKNRTANGEYYRDHILSITCLDTIERSSQTGGITQRVMLDNMSDFYSCRMVHGTYGQIDAAVA